jgi:hypothetical protein
VGCLRKLGLLLVVCGFMVGIMCAVYFCTYGFDVLTFVLWCVKVALFYLFPFHQIQRPFVGILIYSMHLINAHIKLIYEESRDKSQI